MRARDPVSFVGGIAIAVLGVLLVLDQAGALDMSAGWIGAALCAAIGVTLVASGIADSDS
jgi:hypothetical protein